MSFDTKVEGITEKSQVILDNFFGQYKEARSRTILINRIPNEIGINDFGQLTYEHYLFLINKYQSTDSYVKYIETFFNVKPCNSFELQGFFLSFLVFCNKIRFTLWI